jgi:hypothetical protein
MILSMTCLRHVACVGREEKNPLLLVAHPVEKELFCPL